MSKSEMHNVYVSYEEARKLIPIFKYYAKEGPWREVRADGSRLARELEDVENRDYSPLPGKQVNLNEREYEFFVDVRSKVD